MNNKKIVEKYELVKDEYEKSLLDYQKVFKSTRKGDKKRSDALCKTQFLKIKLDLLENRVYWINKK